MVFGTLIIGAIIIACLYKLNKDYVVLTLFTKRVRTVDGTPLENSVALPKGLTIFGNAFDFALASEGSEFVCLFNVSEIADLLRDECAMFIERIANSLPLPILTKTRVDIELE